MDSLKDSDVRLSTGISGLDNVIHGGLVPRRAYMVRGGPGTGKTILGMHFLTNGVSNSEKVLFISMGETKNKIFETAESLGFDLNEITFLDLSPNSEFFTDVKTYDIFSPAEVEREPLTKKIVEQVEELEPKRVFIDAMTQFRYLTPDEFQFHKEVLSFLHFLTEQGATVLFTSESTKDNPDDDLQFMSDGVINLEFDSERRTVSVTKFRGSDFKNGNHSMKITNSGIEVFPRLIADVYSHEFEVETFSSGVPELDELLKGGLERGTTTIISGPSGVGKTTLGLQFMKEAAGRGEHSIVYTFDEEREFLLKHCEAINIPVYSMVENDKLSVIRVEPTEFTADEFAFRLCQKVEEQNTSIVMIDSVSSYRLFVQAEKDWYKNLHTLCKYMKNIGVSLLLVNEVESITGTFKVTESKISYLADNIIFFRYIEIQGEISRTIGVLKKRLSDFEKNLRRFEITLYGIKVGEPLTEIRGILSGSPELVRLVKEE